MKKTLCVFVILAVVSFSLAAGGGGQTQQTAGGPVKLSYWEVLGTAANAHSSLATHPGWIELQKRMGVEIDFRTPPRGGANEREAFNLMVTSRNFPDIITYSWFSLPGGPGQYIQDDVIIKLNDPIDKWAPDVKKAFQKFPVARREATLDDGTLYCFPQIYSTQDFGYQYGPMARKDLLEKVPGVNASQFPGNMETLEEWERILTAVKNSGLKGDSGRDIIPLSYLFDDEDNQISSFIMGAWGINQRFTQENGKAVYGPADPRYREYLTLMKRWYDNGLIDREFAANDDDMLDEKVLDNRVFAFVGYMGGSFTRYTGLGRESNPAFMINALKYPVLKKGDKPALAYKANDFYGTGAAITTACKNVETAVRLLNYDYTDEGYILGNFGIEGQTFNWDSSNYTTQLISSTHAGFPRYTDIIMNNPQYTKDVTTGTLIRARLNIGVKAVEFLNQRDNLPEQLGPVGRSQWMDASNANRMPAVYATEQESADLGRIMNDINTYADESTVAFITGTRALNDANWNAYIQTMKGMNLDRALTILTAQIERYNKRP